jgi:uncharacterized protein (DUF1697 family)
VTGYVCLLRGVNLGPSTQVSMADLKRIFEDLGLASVTTYIRSGNVVFGSDDDPATLLRRIEPALADGLGTPVDIVLRTHHELAGVLDHNPFPEADPARLAVVFLSRPVAEELTAHLDRTDYGDDEYAGAGGEVYLHLPHGFGRSRLGARMSGTRGPVVATVRNWRTVTKLRDLSAPG